MGKREKNARYVTVVKDLLANIPDINACISASVTDLVG